MNTFRQSFLNATSVKGEKPELLLKGGYDFAFLSSSWDLRSEVICKLDDIEINQILLLLPYEKEFHNCGGEVDDVLISFAEKKVKDVVTVNERENIEDTFLNIEKCIFDGDQLTFPVDSVLIDLSVMNIAYSLGLISLLIKRGLAKNIDIFYAEAEYDGNVETPKINFSLGDWTKKVIPYLDGVRCPTMPISWVINLGFEGEKIRRLLLKNEPDVVKLTLPIPGFSSIYDDRSENECRYLSQEFGLVENDTIKACAADPIAVWSELAKQKDWFDDDWQVFYICAGTKPHSLGLALHAIVTSDPTVCYVQPDKYKHVDIRPNGNYWLYSISDHSNV